MSEPILALRGVERVYKTEAGDLPVLRGVDIDVYPGEVVGLIGPSGSGKSSLLHSAGLLERPDGGLVALEGRDCSKLSERVRTRIRLGTVGFVYQFHHLLPEFSALENVAMPLTIAGKSRREAEARAKELLESTQLAISEICYRVGYQDVASFSRLFSRITGMPPGEYRRQSQ